MRTKDHVIPKSQGGTKTVEACFRCNQAKSDMSLQEFRALRGGGEFWAEQASRIENQKVSWVYQYDNGVITPVDYERPKSFKVVPTPKPKKKTQQEILNVTFEDLIANSLPDMRGKEFGFFTVIGWKMKEGCWKVSCICRNEELRTTKAVRNSNNTLDCCAACNKLARELRRALYVETGKEPTLEECLKDLYRFHREKRGEEDGEQAGVRD